jgi:uncharacterized membrane protein YdjX (TVP38/TMEM64 family)
MSVDKKPLDKNSPRKKIPFGKIILVLVVLSAISAFFVFDLSAYFNFDYIKSQQSAFTNYYQENPFTTIALFFLIYVVSTALSFPGASILTLLGGALFGLVWGTVIVSFASTIGATLAFLASRTLLKDFVQEKFSTWLEPINEGIKKEGAFYLFTLRLVPLFPFFAVNLLMGLTPISVFTYFWVSQVGMFLGTIVYVNAGSQLAQLDSLQGILSLELLFAFVLLGVFPWLTKQVLKKIQALQKKQTTEN